MPADLENKSIKGCGIRACRRCCNDALINGSWLAVAGVAKIAKRDFIADKNSSGVSGFYPPCLKVPVTGNLGCDCFG